MADPQDQNPAGAPRQQVSAADRGAMDSALQSMAQMDTRMGNVERMVEGLVRHFTKVQGTVKDTERSLDAWGGELSTVLRKTANLEYTMKRIKQLQKARIGAGTSQEGTLAYVKSLQAEAATLFKVLNKTQGAGRYTKEYAKILRDLNREMKTVKKTAAATWDSSNVARVNAELTRMSKSIDHIANSMKRVQVKKFTEGFKDMGRVMHDSFDSQISRVLMRSPLLNNIVGNFRGAKQFKASVTQAQAGLADLQSQRRVAQQARMRANASAMVDQFGPRARGTLARMGYHEPARTGTRTGSMALTPTQRRAAASGGGLLSPAAGPAPGQLVGPDGQPVFSGRPTGPTRGSLLQRGLSGFRQRMTGAPAAPSVTEVQRAMSGSGGLLSGAVNKIAGSALEKGGTGTMANLARSLVTRGGGSAAAGLGESALAGSSSLLSGGMEIASKAAVPLAIVKGLVDIRDKVAVERRKIQDSLGGLGIHGAGAEGVNFSKVRSTLLSTGFGNAAMMGQGLQENMDIMKTLGEGGYAPGRTLRSGNLDLGAALEQKNGLTGNGFYGTVMKNAVYNGKNLGMSQDASVRLTMKLMEKFGKTTEATQGFFLHLDDMMQSSGVSASKYIDIVDNLTDQFNDMNKNLDGTVTILNTLGRSGRLTGEAMQKMIKDLQAPNQMNTAQRMFNAMGMVRSGGADMAATALESGQAHQFEQIQKALADQGVKVNSFEELNQNRAAIETQLAQQLGDRPEELKAITDSLDKTVTQITASKAQSSALRSGNPQAIAAAAGQFGESPVLAMATKMGSIQTILQEAGYGKDMMNRIMSGDQNAIQELSTGKGALVAERLKGQGILQNDFDLVGTLNSVGGFKRAGAINAVQFGQKLQNGSVDELLASQNGQDKYESILRLQKARIQAGYAQAPQGLTGAAADKEMVNQFIKMSRGEKSGELTKQLTTLQETFTQLMDEGSPMAKAMQGTKDALLKRQAEDKAKEIQAQTRTTADIFAKSFEYLFDRVVGFLDHILRLINKIPGLGEDLEGQRAVATQRTNALGIALRQVDTGKLSQEDQARYEDIQSKVKGEYYAASGDMQGLHDAEAYIARLTGAALGPGGGQVERIQGNPIAQEDVKGLAGGVSGGRNLYGSFANFSNDMWARGVKDVGADLIQHASKGTTSDTLTALMSGLDPYIQAKDVQAKTLSNGNTLINANDDNVRSMLQEIADAFPKLVEKQGNGWVIHNNYGGLVLQDPHVVTRFGGQSPVAPQVQPTVPTGNWVGNH